ncbi:D-alanyl-D-alanine carboxypeptidase [Vibrio phage 1.042.O._10N.286.45.B8]|nr:D-alanyl-D-alanine carboxypeptidase [Vibrio phage 1.042.O._10N.286.45.B8]
MTFKFSQRSIDKLSTCHEDLERVAYLALKYSPYDFGIIEGVRTIEKQREYYNAGKSKTMNSRHMENKNGVSEALDIAVYVNGKITWDIKYYRKVAQAFFKAAIELNVQIRWGGLWESFVDGPHFELGNN